MNSERAERLVSALRARGVMAHVAEAGVYQFGVRVVIDWNIEAIWDTDGAAGLDAQVLSDGMLVGFVPHVEGSEDFTEQQLVDTIANTSYSTEGLRPPSDAETAAGGSGVAPRPDSGTGSSVRSGTPVAGEPDRPDATAPPPPPEQESGPPGAPGHRRPKDRWWKR
ncbi:hypothetical protein [Streptomyces sp. NBC_00859]|uniref:hypothetical protein n=1 Tax=Streptomyces sp. NBC_00859 TaxID=2903682 RepID=UPI00386E9A4A|nr:hypothetical protein OG584_32720 [Streptomyces sp. NBC_00859]